ncbi:proprotein convertase P-domain-containing protein [Aeromonas caviae]|uniref:Proprotein convertase P-domain-containing protein n=1 Tax=Aeromonas caviae TaxID=648 RepID=A0A6S5IR37_AERCA|nr:MULTISPECIES: proprotein convertase P-domain-containing protein [Aeromonas]MBP4066906.1 proprotein convertase P-domain-containing protein [Aeromonas sp. MaB10011B]MBP4078327.1 proprotein convertase P-domain-containing protein [Aeromonas sp. MrichA-1]MDH1897545.1 proprotein convertase P-domain-containing protein [Aeromonas caviae]UJQ38318.1 proprotein convertase P-domain-containing protein [Aeromonas caviae]BBS17758.1 peptidase M36 [Aeromonas caviae]
MKPSSLALWLAATLISSPLLAADLQFVDEQPLTTTPKRWLEQRLGVLLAPDYDRASLLGHHYSFRQLVNGLPVAATQAAVSVDGDGRPWRLYHNLRPLQSTAPGCDASGTLDPLLATLRTDDNQIETLGPVEAWYWRDGDTLVPALRQRVREHKAGNAKASQVQLFARCDGEQELGRLGDQATTHPLHVADAGDMKVQARVFDPDPRTRLQDASLVWHDELVLAQAAYQDPVPLPVSLQAGQYRLSGPHARVVDVMAPESAPYSSSDVQGFRLTRDDRGFADINAYYHLDLAQRHLKALGFTELIPGALDIDTDAGYQDNSLYDPFERRLELGRSGVPDAEDPMVIWHEFGHGVQHHILPDLGEEGDWGAIGEGFGDYLAASQRQRSEAGRQFEPAMVFNWDARFTDRTPRQLDDLRARYHPDYRYPAHRTINGSNGDQLWGTPLFQALLTAVAEHGEAARDEFDRVIIESHFGLGPAIRMPQLARITVDTAARLYPTRAYARLLEQAFRQHGLLQAPVNIALAEGSAIPLGQRQSVQLTLSNPGKGEVTLNELALTLPTGLQADPDSWQPATLAAGASMTTTLRLLAQSPLACGDEASLSVNLAMSGTSPTERQWQQSLTLPIGTPVISRASGRSQRLNDAQSEEVRGLSETSLLLEKSDARVSDRLQLSLDLQHEVLDELEIWLSSPAGTRVQIWDKGYSPLPSLKGVFPTELQSLQPFSAFEGEPLAGRWTLEVVDSKPGNQGFLNGWSISQRTGAQCGNTVPVPDDGIIRFDTSDSSGGGAFPLLWLLPLALWRRLRRL